MKELLATMSPNDIVVTALVAAALLTAYIAVVILWVVNRKLRKERHRLIGDYEWLKARCCDEDNVLWMNKCKEMRHTVTVQAGTIISLRELVAELKDDKREKALNCAIAATSFGETDPVKTAKQFYRFLIGKA